MPIFHRFNGFRIDIRSRDHNPPHFHLIGPDFHALVDIRTLTVLEGTVSRRALAEAISWAEGRKDALMTEWRRLNERD